MKTKSKVKKPAKKANIFKKKLDEKKSSKFKEDERNFRSEKKKVIPKTKKEKQYDNEMRIAAFTAKAKKGSKRPPAHDLTAVYTVEGEKEYIDLFKEESKAGNTYYKGEGDTHELVLFKNLDKEGNQPDMTGKLISLEDEDDFLRVSLWSGKSESGVRYLSGQLQPPWEGNGEDNDEDNEEGEDFEDEETSEEENDDLPF